METLKYQPQHPSVLSPIVSSLLTGGRGRLQILLLVLAMKILWCILKGKDHCSKKSLLLPTTLWGDCSHSDTTNSPHGSGRLAGGKIAAREAPTLCRSDRTGGDAVGYLPASHLLSSTPVR